MIPMGFWTWAFFLGLPTVLAVIAVYILVTAEGKGERQKRQKLLDT